MTNDVDAVEDLLDKSDYEMMNLMGVASTIKKGFRRLHSTFGGIGLYSFVDEQLIERLNVLMQHHMTGSSLSKKLRVSLAYMQLQIGTNVCPFDLNYDLWSHTAPLSWVKMLWRTLHVAHFEIHLEHQVIPVPRVRDCVLMQFFMDRGSDIDELKSLSRMRVFF